MKKAIGFLFLIVAAVCLWIAPIQAETAAVVEVDVTYKYDMARNMMTQLNNFRTSNTWYWDQSDSEKIQVSGLSALTYDYELEKTAMLRAAECAVMYSHTRPDETSCFTAFPDTWGSKGENIAAGYKSTESVFNAWREENESYSGQGHRRNMLNSSFKYIGIGCVYVPSTDTYYWAQSFSSASGNSEAENNSPARINVSAYFLKNRMNNASMNTTVIQVKGGQSKNLPTINANSENNFYGTPVKIVSAPWQASSDVIAVTGTKVYGQHSGDATASVEVGNETFSVNVNVEVGRPFIKTQPENINVDEGKTATFKVVAYDATAYQWYYRQNTDSEWKSVSKNGTSNPFSLTVEARHDGFEYCCLVKNSQESVFSEAVTLTVNPKPVITSQPVNAQIYEGKPVTFKVTAKYADSFQWYYSVPGENTWRSVTKNGTADTLSLTVKPKHNGYKYRCKVKNSVAAVFSKDVTLTVIPKPTITKQPVSVTVNEGDKATFTITAADATSYQWYYCTPSGSVWSKVTARGTSATYSLTTAFRHNGYKYKCLATNGAGGVYSDIVTLTVKPKPVITSQPVSVTVSEGQTATLKVVATNAATYQWYYCTSGSSTWKMVVRNGTSDTYSITAEARHNGNQYRCLVKNTGGAVYSTIATLTVVPKPIITEQPTDVKVNAGQKAMFKVTATGAKSYRWYYNKPGESDWNAVSVGGTSAAYSLTAEARHNGYKYSCKISNGAGSVWSAAVTLTVLSKPDITKQPVNTTVNVGQKATLKVVANNVTAYQWYYKKPDDSNWYNVTVGGTSSSYTLTAAARHNGYQYRCKVSNDVGSVYSDIVTLTVTPATANAVDECRLIRCASVWNHFPARGFWLNA